MVKPQNQMRRQRKVEKGGCLQFHFWLSIYVRKTFCRGELSKLRGAMDLPNI